MDREKVATGGKRAGDEGGAETEALVGETWRLESLRHQMVCLN